MEQQWSSILVYAGIVTGLECCEISTKNKVTILKQWEAFDLGKDWYAFL